MNQSTLKKAARKFFAAAGWMFAKMFRVTSPVLGQSRTLQGLSEFLSLFPGMSGKFLRYAAYKEILKACGKNCDIGFGTVFSKRQAVLGDHVYIGRYCSLGWVEIESEVMIADFVSIPSGGNTHKIKPGVPPRKMKNAYSPVRIGEGSWLGLHSVIMADVGKYCVVGAGAVVTKPLPDFSIAGGVPAKIIGQTNQSKSG